MESDLILELQNMIEKGLQRKNELIMNEEKIKEKLESNIKLINLDTSTLNKNYDLILSK